VSAPAEATRRPIRRALVSVYDKAGLAELAVGLHRAGVTIVSTGSTAAHLRDAGVPVTAVSDVTGFPEILDGRVKTLHPHVHAALLADLRRPAHEQALAELGIAPFDLLVSNLYPFRETVAAGAGADDTVEQIDIGGPAMIRAAAKNHPSVAVVVDPARYPDVLAAAAAGGFDLAARRVLAAAAFAHTAAYDAAVANWFARPDDLPPYLGLGLERGATLRYGENPHQRAALYLDPDAAPGVAQADQLHGKAMSYNNYVDADAAWRAAHDFPGRTCVAIVKHTNPCGIALGADVAEAHRLAHACDPVSAYGGVIATNRPVSLDMARQVAEVFTEVVVAPGYDPDALELLARKASIRLLVASAPVPEPELRRIGGGFLLQTPDRIDAAGDDPADWQLVAGPPADDATLADLAFAWRAVRAVKSNAILLADAEATVGVGMGQVNRVDAARLAVARAGDRARGSVAASDAFFPFADGLQVLADAGVRAVAEPGGSMRDGDVTAAAEAAGLSLYFTGTRHFTH
jgi:phosphoribosylaminoimidazolecarboxamide formyltransferase/IMP cyclohydrolase